MQRNDHLTLLFPLHTIFFKRYYSSFIDAFLSIAVNWYGPDSGRTITYKDVLGFCVFCAWSSNGCTSICEIARFLSIYSATKWEDDVENFFNFDSNFLLENLKEFMESEMDTPSNMYDFLYNLGEFQQYNQPGYGSQNRSQTSSHSSGSNRYDFEELAETLLELFQEASLPTRNVLESKQKFNELITNLVAQVKGVKAFKALQLVQLSAMFGLIPMEFSKFASISGKNSEKRGPNKLIELCTSNSRNESCADNPEVQNRIFNGLCAEISSCYGNDYGGIPKYFPSKLENTMCEIWRILKNYVTTKYSGDPKLQSH